MVGGYNMTRVALLEALKNFIEDEIKDIKYPVSVQKGDEKARTKTPEVFKMRLPDSESAKKIVPYIIIQYVNGVDKQSHSQRSESSCIIRIIFTTYSEDEQAGAIMLMNLMDTVRLGLLKKVVIGGCFKLDTDAGLEDLIYNDDTAPYYAGEMVGTFILPPIEREVSYE
jgi:hypothetical protein